MSKDYTHPPALYHWGCLVFVQFWPALLVLLRLQPVAASAHADQVLGVVGTTGTQGNVVVNEISQLGETFGFAPLTQRISSPLALAYRLPSVVVPALIGVWPAVYSLRLAWAAPTVGEVAPGAPARRTRRHSIRRFTSGFVCQRP